MLQKHLTFLVLLILSSLAASQDFLQILDRNKKWASNAIKNDREYFSRHASGQSPKFIWIGCSDSRVDPNQILGLGPGQVFVVRNVANQAQPSDISVMTSLQYAVDVLGVQDIIVAGHTACGGVRASLSNDDFGALEHWLSYLRDIKVRHHQQLHNLNKEDRETRMTEINVIQQVMNIARTSFVQKAWENGKQLRIHGTVYELSSGILRDLSASIDSIGTLSQSHRLFTKCECQKKEEVKLTGEQNNEDQGQSQNEEEKQVKFENNTQILDSEQEQSQSQKQEKSDL